MSWKETTPSLLPEYMPNKGTKQLFAEYWGRATLIFGSSLFLLLWPKLLGKLNRNSPHSIQNMLRSLTSLREENSPLDDLLIME